MAKCNQLTSLLFKGPRLSECWQRLGLVLTSAVTDAWPVRHNCQSSHLISAADEPRSREQSLRIAGLSSLMPAQEPADCHNVLSKTAGRGGNRLHVSAPQGIAPNRHASVVASSTRRQYVSG